jgi:hypothetical protein
MAYEEVPEEINVRRSIEDFLDPRARQIMLAHALSPDEIFPLYAELDTLLRADDYDLTIDPNQPQGPLIKKFLCGAVVAYELSQSKIVGFLDRGEPAILRRDKPSETFSAAGRHWEGMAKRLTNGIEKEFE